MKFTFRVQQISLNTLSVMMLLGGLTSAVPAYAGTPLVVSAKITSPNTVAVTYSESVNTTLNDYGSFTGSLSNASLSGMSGSGTNVIVLSFNNVSLAGNTTGGLTIANTVKSVADSSPIGGGPYNITDGQSPTISSFSMSSNLSGGTVARTGDTVTISFNTSEPVNNPSATIDGHTVSVSGSGIGAYTASYTITSSDVQDAVPVTVSFRDASGNPGSGSFMLGGGLGPRIVSITSDANSTGVLGVGNTINFILTLASPVSNAYVSGSYDTVPLTWTTNNGGATYTATYTIQQTNPSASVPLQISGVTVRDASGNVSMAASGSDIQKTVNAQSFSISLLSAVASPVQSGTAARFSFYSSQDGTIAYTGACSSTNLTASTGNNYMTLRVLLDGTYNNCGLTVTDAAGYTSNTLMIPSFVVGTGAASVVPVVSVQPQAVTSSVKVSAYKFSRQLLIGSVGADVTALQKILAAEGLYSGPITNKFGALTAAAVKKYQKLHGLKQLGTVGPGTRAILNSGL